METILGTAVVGMVVAGYVILTIKTLIRDKRNGKALCGCGGECKHCGGHCTTNTSLK